MPTASTGSSRLQPSLLCLIGLLIVMVACQPAAPPDTRAADEAALREADLEFSKAATAKDLERCVVFYTEDASMLPPNQPIATGKEAIRKVFTDMMAIPGFSISWRPTKVEVSRSSDLGYTIGTYQLTLHDPSGNPMSDAGKYATVWKRSADGTWKVTVDIFNSDEPLPGAQAH